MESILNLIERAADVLASQNVLGFNPLLCIAVFAFVSVISRGLKIRIRFPDMKNLILALLCILVSFLVMMSIYLTNPNKDADYISKFYVLAGVTSLSYQIFKPLVRLAYNKLVEKTGFQIEGVTLLDDTDDII